MPVHPVDPDPFPPGAEPRQPANPTQLPVEPEFGQPLPPDDPEEPGAHDVAPR